MKIRLFYMYWIFKYLKFCFFEEDASNCEKNFRYKICFKTFFFKAFGIKIQHLKQIFCCVCEQVKYLKNVFWSCQFWSRFWSKITLMLLRILRRSKTFLNYFIFFYFVGIRWCCEMYLEGQSIISENSIKKIVRLYSTGNWAPDLLFSQRVLFLWATDATCVFLWVIHISLDSTQGGRFYQNVRWVFFHKMYYRLNYSSNPIGLVPNRSYSEHTRNYFRKENIRKFASIKIEIRLHKSLHDNLIVR